MLVFGVLTGSSSRRDIGHVCQCPGVRCGDGLNEFKNRSYPDTDSAEVRQHACIPDLQSNKDNSNSMID